MASIIGSLMSGNTNISRRQVLGSIGTAGVTTFGLKNSISGVAAQEDRNVSGVQKRTEKELIKEIKSSSEVQELKSELAENRGNTWSIDYQMGKYRKIAPKEGNVFYLCSIPLTFPSGELSGALVWSSSSKRYTRISVLDHSDSAGGKSKDFIEVTYTHDNSGVVKNTDVFEAEVNDQGESGGASTEDYIAPPGGICYRCGCQEVVTENCVDYNVSCIAIVAGSLGISCNPYTGYVSCFLGATFSGILPWVTGDNCNICDEYEVERSKIGYACEYDS